MRALLAIKHFGYGVTAVKVWSDSKVVLVAGWEELWDRALALRSRGVEVKIKKVKAHTNDEALASTEQQAGN
eukprot:5703318-Karenia_brevis.AAC.1